MIYILTSSKTILKTEVRPQTSNSGDKAAEALLNLKLKQHLAPSTFEEQQSYLSGAAIAAHVSLNKLDQRRRYRASVDLISQGDGDFNFARGSSSSGLGYALALITAWWSRVLEKPGQIDSPVFATGEILKSGQLKPIGHLAEKIESTCAFVEDHKAEFSKFYLCFPEENDVEITGEHRERVARLGGFLLPVSRLQVLLGQLLGDSYDGDTLGRWEPFKGLRSFEYEDSARFFGRKNDVQRLYDDLNKSDGLLIVTGASGTGKSSLIKAGLVPRIEADDKPLYWAHTTPNSESQREGMIGFIFQHLDRAWGLGQSGCVLSDLISTFKKSTNAGIQALQKVITAEPDRCLLIIDQFEEIFGQHPNADDFVNQALGLMNELALRLNPLYFVLVLRSEYLSQLLDSRSLHSPIISNISPKLSSDDWFAIVHEQAQFSGLTFETRNGLSLDKVLVEEAVQTTYALPMVEFLLEQLYLRATEREANSSTLSFSDYEQMGGLVGAIAYRATQVIEESGADNQTVAKLFVNFVGSGTDSLPFARPISLGRVRGFDTDLQALIQNLKNANLIVNPQSSEMQSMIKLAHDSLFDHWSQLSDWLVSNKEYLAWFHDVERKFLVWQSGAAVAEGIFDDYFSRIEQKLERTENDIQKKYRAVEIGSYYRDGLCGDGEKTKRPHDYYFEGMHERSEEMEKSHYLISDMSLITKGMSYKKLGLIPNDLKRYVKLSLQYKIKRFFVRFCYLIALFQILT